ncbi:hypothetical protein NDU88_007192 [Pleurodeles waltl]|uniref:Uncharacterized protein n=1 Tax=Pleurodeles waltl TaxID=8319 RepID=A0AAV7VP11_PLEWA|nr:hypothetical protein NDU88_007192 [Pleurodeles waltl]
MPRVLYLVRGSLSVIRVFGAHGPAVLVAAVSLAVVLVAAVSLAAVLVAAVSLAAVLVAAVSLAVVQLLGNGAAAGGPVWGSVAAGGRLLGSGAAAGGPVWGSVAAGSHLLGSRAASGGPVWGGGAAGGRLLGSGADGGRLLGSGLRAVFSTVLIFPDLPVFLCPFPTLKGVAADSTIPTVPLHRPVGHVRRWRHAPVYRPQVDLSTMEERRVIITYRLDRATILELCAQLEPDLM